jgi:hypothetical protein
MDSVPQRQHDPPLLAPRAIEIVVTDLADNEQRLARDLAAVRELLHLTLGLLHAEQKQHERVREQHRRLLGEYRTLRASVLTDQRRAA